MAQIFGVYISIRKMFTFQQIYRYFLSSMNHISLLATDKIEEKFQVSQYDLINTLRQGQLIEITFFN